MNMADIRQAVAREFDITVRALMGRRRAIEVSRPRQVAMWLSRAYTYHSLPEIGLFFDRDHTTVMHACRTVSKLMAQDEDFRSRVIRIEAGLSAGKFYRHGEEGYLVRGYHAPRDEVEAMHSVDWGAV